MRVSRCFDFHPGFDGAADVFERPVAGSVGNDGGQSVEDFEFEGFVAQVKLRKVTRRARAAKG
jgi:hypothetical protein